MSDGQLDDKQNKKREEATHTSTSNSHLFVSDKEEEVEYSPITQALYCFCSYLFNPQQVTWPHSFQGWGRLATYDGKSTVKLNGKQLGYRKFKEVQQQSHSTVVLLLLKYIILIGKHTLTN